MKRIMQVLAMVFCVAGCFFVSGSFAQEKPQLKVGLIFDIGGRGDSGYNDSAFRGFEKAAREFGIKTVLVEPKRSLEKESAFKSLAASDVDMVIAVGFRFSEEMNALAAQYPQKKFACVDYSARYDDKGNLMPPATNLAGLTFKEEEGSYLVGAIAALKSTTGTIGFIGGMDSPIIRKFEAGYVSGARAARRDIRVLSRFAGITGKAFDNPAKGEAIARRMYRDGADVIFHAAGMTGMGLFKAAKELNKLAVGVDTDQYAQAPGLVLTSMTKNVDVAVYESIKALAQGRFSGGLKVFGLKENGVGFVYDGNNKALIPEDAYKKALALKERIVKGETVVPTSIQTAQKFTPADLKDLLAQIHSETAAALRKLEGDLKQSADALSGIPLKGSGARDVLKKLYAANPYIIDCETVSDKGIMLVVEPAQFSASEGADISAQAHMKRLFQTKEPILSGAFRSVEGPEAVVLHYPVFTPEKTFKGSVSALFGPEYLLGRIIGPVTALLSLDITLMQPDGTFIYDIRPSQIGMNAFTAPLFQPFPEVMALVKRVGREPEGIATYHYTRPDTRTVVTREAYWKTIAFHGAEWRLLITCSWADMEMGK